MDDTWIDSQIDTSDKTAEGEAAGGDRDDDGAVADDWDDDSDAASDILPQYDGPPDEKGEYPLPQSDSISVAFILHLYD